MKHYSLTVVSLLLIVVYLEARLVLRKLDVGQCQQSHATSTVIPTTARPTTKTSTTTKTFPTTKTPTTTKAQTTRSPSTTKSPSTTIQMSTTSKPTNSPTTTIAQTSTKSPTTYAPSTRSPTATPIPTILFPNTTSTPLSRYISTRVEREKNSISYILRVTENPTISGMITVGATYFEDIM